MHAAAEKITDRTGSWAIHAQMSKIIGPAIVISISKRWPRIGRGGKTDLAGPWSAPLPGRWEEGFSRQVTDSMNDLMAFETF